MFGLFIFHMKEAMRLKFTQERSEKFKQRSDDMEKERKGLRLLVEESSVQIDRDLSPQARCFSKWNVHFEWSKSHHIEQGWRFHCLKDNER